MMTFYNSHYSKEEVHVLRGMFYEAKAFLEDELCNCPRCKGCHHRNLCKDINRMIKYLTEVLDSNKYFKEDD